MKKKLAYLKLLWSLLKISRNPENTSAVFDIGEALYALGATEKARLKFSQDADSKGAITERKWIAPYNLLELQKLPAGTLGRAYADHMISLNLDPNFYREIEIKNDVTYVMMRMRQTHDLWHVMTGFNTTVPGEIGLQAFMAAQTSLPLAPVLIGGSLFQAAVKKNELLDPIMENLITGWKMGKKAKLIFGLDWEANWSVSLTEIRHRYGIETAI